MHKKIAVSNPLKCIANLRTQPIHLKMNLEIYQTSFVMKEVLETGITETEITE